MSLKITILLSICFCPFVSLAQHTVYPATEGMRSSPAYEVYVNGKPLFVYDSPVPASYAGFDLNGVAEIVIKTNRDLKWVHIRPISAGITPVFKDSTIRFRIAQPCQLSIELNGLIKHPLFLFANPPEADKPARNDKNVFYFESGRVYYAGKIELKSNQTVYIEGGAVVVGVIKSTGANNIRIAGRGILDGSYNRKFNDALIKTGDREKINADTVYRYERFIELGRCSNVSIEGITLHNSTSWQVVPENCSNVVINNIKIISDQPSDDGIDVVHSKNVSIKNCFIRVKDDCVVIKAYLPRTESLPVDSVHVSNCVFWNGIWGNAIEIGFELDGADVKNIVFNNIDLIHVQDGAAMSIHNAGTSIVSNVLFDDIRVEDANHKLIDLAIFRSRYSQDGSQDEAVWRKLYLNGAWDGVLMVPPDQQNYHASFRGHIRNIIFRNIRIIDGPHPFSIFYGFGNAHLVQNILIENLQVYGRRIKSLKEAKCYLENARNITIR